MCANTDRIYSEEQVRNRDKAWHAVLKTMKIDRSFRIKDILYYNEDLGESDRRNLQRVLRAMEALGWVDKSTKDSPRYRRGPLFENLHTEDYTHPLLEKEGMP